MTVWLVALVAVLIYALKERNHIKERADNDTVPSVNETTDQRPARYGRAVATSAGVARRSSGRHLESGRADRVRYPTQVGERRAVLTSDVERARLALLGLACEDCPHPIIDRRAR